MPITAIDPTAALVVIDLQRGTVANTMAHPTEQVVERAAELAAAFRQHGLPVLFAYSSGTPSGRTAHGDGGRRWPAEFSEPLPEVTPRPEDLTVVRPAWGALAGTVTAELQERGVTQLVLAGVATTFGVESTARQAYDAGFHVAIALDAVTDLSIESHDHAMNRVFPVLGQTGTTAEIIAALATF